MTEKAINTMNQEEKYKVYLYLNTDDDAEVVYQGKSYCWYAEPLELEYDNMLKGDLIDMLTEVKVVHGGKASQFTYDFIQDCFTIVNQGEGTLAVTANQVFKFWLDKVEQEKALLDVTEIDGDIELRLLENNRYSFNLWRKESLNSYTLLADWGITDKHPLLRVTGNVWKLDASNFQSFLDLARKGSEILEEHFNGK